jgi:PAS domain S-box-containing protein
MATQPITILNVDDHEGDRSILTRNLQQAGFQVIEARTDEEALQKMTLNPDVVILDVRLPDISRIEVCQRMRTASGNFRLPIIMLSAVQVDGKDKIVGLEGGADIYLTKPIATPVLVATIKALLHARSAERDVLDLAQRWQTTFDAMNEAICIVNLQGIITQCNKSMESLAEKPAKSLINTSFFDLLRSNADEDNPLSQVQKTQRQEKIALSFNNRWFDFAAIPVFDFKGNISEIICVLSDVTEVREYMLRLEASNTELENFALIASHDLREPLRKISAFSERLQKHDLPKEQQQDYLNRVQNAAERMTHMIDNLLLFAQIDNPQNNQVEVDLSAVIQQVVSDLDLLIKDTGGSVEFSTLPIIRADHIQMHRLFQNLITNALKYHRDDVPPVVQVKAHEDNETIYIGVLDNGVGVPEKDMERIFKIFERLHGYNKGGGAGLGLAICRKIVQHHNGKITVESTRGVGTTFIISFPKSMKVIADSTGKI